MPVRFTDYMADTGDNIYSKRDAHYFRAVPCPTPLTQPLETYIPLSKRQPLLLGGHSFLRKKARRRRLAVNTARQNSGDPLSPKDFPSSSQQLVTTPEVRCCGHHSQHSVIPNIHSGGFLEEHGVTLFSRKRARQRRLAVITACQNSGDPLSPKDFPSSSPQLVTTPETQYAAVTTFNIR
ncbi:hypothetical protein J6590_022763 [Homalodisca vitripennis]|nr:hypothetical protein J6590_022763 [Homalodisca vitripennis]